LFVLEDVFGGVKLKRKRGECEVILIKGKIWGIKINKRKLYESYRVMWWVWQIKKIF